MHYFSIVNLKNIYVSGEISNFTNHYRSGHFYFTLKDETSSIKAVMFKSANMRLKFMPENAMSVIIRGRVAVFERDGQYQLYIDALEPDGRNYKKLLLSIEGKENISAINAAAWKEDTTLFFAAKAGRQSSVSKDGKETAARSVDSVLSGKGCSIIKMDVEGAEKQAIEGAILTIKNYNPKLMISLYHRNEDIFSIPLQIKEINPDYKFFLRHQLYIPAWETNLYCI